MRRRISAEQGGGNVNEDNTQNNYLDDTPEQTSEQDEETEEDKPNTPHTTVPTS